MPRLPRYSLPGVPQHVIQRGHNRQPIFFQEDDYRFYLTCLQETTARHATAVHAYVLMTNHVHVLMTPHQLNSIAKVMQALGRRYVPYINATYQRTGTLWEGRYRASLVDLTNTSWRATGISNSTRSALAWCSSRRRIPGQVTAGTRVASTTRSSRTIRFILP